MADSVSRLKELLFDQEAATLSDLGRRIEQIAATDAATASALAERLRQLEEAQRQGSAEIATRVEAESRARGEIGTRVDDLARRTGTPEALRTSVAEVIDDVIVEAREHRQDQLQRAMAPLLVRVIQAELKNNQKAMVDALYPITGELVKAYVAAAVKEMTRKINRQLELNPMMLRVRSMVSGYSVAELALAETEKLEVEELYLIRRGSGELIQRWPESPGRSNSDIHMSGVLAAINDFAGQAFQGDGGHLRSFDMGEALVFLRASPAYLLAAKCRGSAVTGIQALIDSEFLTTVAQQQAAETAQAGGGLAGRDSARIPSELLGDLKARLERGITTKYEHIQRAGLPFNPLKAIGAAAALLLLGLAGWWGWTSWEVATTRSAVQQVVERFAPMQGYPVLLDVGWRGRSVGLSGLAPSETAKAELVRLLRGDPALERVEIRDRGLATLPVAGPDVRPQIAEVRRDLTGLESAVRTDLSGLQTSVRRDLAGLETEMARAAMQRALDRAARRLEQALPDLQHLSALSDTRQRAIAGKARTTVERAVADLAGQRQTVRDPATDRSRLAGLQGPLTERERTLQGIGAELATLVGGATAAPRAAEAVPGAPNALEAAENMALAAERVATIAAAAAQASAVRVPPPAPPPAGPSPRERLVSFARANAVFFANNEDYRAPQQADRTLDELARLMREADALLRVVGYTDERGTTQRNSQLAMSRAEKVVQALVSRGVAQDRLVAIGRGSGPDLSPNTGPQSPNRRVEFEVGFVGEAAAGP